MCWTEPGILLTFLNLDMTVFMLLYQSVDTKSLSTLGLYKDQLRTQILKNKYQLGTRCDSKKEFQGPGLKVIF